MVFEWDETKREVNRDKHKLDLIDGQYLFDGRPVVSFPSSRGDEARFVTVGPIGPKFYAVVWTERSGATRLISFRRARDGEERAYRARFG
ncbi:MAG TPA: BrnT family toxin [Acetobacteraceae bacterium]|jgi:hypothetical protein|nr:BrnT family toxin [Acetobacteraceae bacterium]HEX4366379.1 BrnT family toxin [Rhodopila sp.]